MSKAIENGWNVYKFTSDSDASKTELLGSEATESAAYALAQRLGGDQIQEGLDGRVENVTRARSH